MKISSNNSHWPNHNVNASKTVSPFQNISNANTNLPNELIDQLSALNDELHKIDFLHPPSPEDIIKIRDKMVDLNEKIQTSNLSPAQKKVFNDANLRLFPLASTDPRDRVPSNFGYELNHVIAGFEAGLESIKQEPPMTEQQVLALQLFKSMDYNMRDISIISKKTEFKSELTNYINNILIINDYFAQIFPPPAFPYDPQESNTCEALVYREIFKMYDTSGAGAMLVNLASPQGQEILDRLRKITFS